MRGLATGPSYRMRYRLGPWETHEYRHVEAGGLYDHEEQWREDCQVAAWRTGDFVSTGECVEVVVADRALADRIFRMLWSRYPSVTLRDPALDGVERSVRNVRAEDMSPSVLTASVCCEPAVLRIGQSVRDKRAMLEAIRRAQMPKAPRNRRVATVPAGRANNLTGVTPPRLRAWVLERDNFRCMRCGATPVTTALEVDHIVPRAKGGLTVADNLQTLCWSCNRGKCDSDPHPDELARVQYPNRSRIMKERITRSEYLQLVGLLTLAAGHERQLKEIERAVVGILDAKLDENSTRYYGHISDEVYAGNGEPNADRLLQRLHVAVDE